MQTPNSCSSVQHIISKEYWIEYRRAQQWTIYKQTIDFYKGVNMSIYKTSVFTYYTIKTMC